MTTCKQCLEIVNGDNCYQGGLCGPCAKTLRASCDTLMESLVEWLDKTDWVQEEGLGSIGDHRADVIRQLVLELHARLNVLEDIVAVAQKVALMTPYHPWDQKVVEELRVALREKEMLP